MNISANGKFTRFFWDINKCDRDRTLQLVMGEEVHLYERNYIQKKKIQRIMH